MKFYNPLQSLPDVDCPASHSSQLRSAPLLLKIGEEYITGYYCVNKDGTPISTGHWKPKSYVGNYDSQIKSWAYIEKPSKPIKSLVDGLKGWNILESSVAPFSLSLSYMSAVLVVDATGRTKVTFKDSHIPIPGTPQGGVPLLEQIVKTEQYFNPIKALKLAYKQVRKTGKVDNKFFPDLIPYRIFAMAPRLFSEHLKGAIEQDLMEIYVLQKDAFVNTLYCEEVLRHLHSIGFKVHTNSDGYLCLEWTKNLLPHMK